MIPCCLLVSRSVMAALLQFAQAALWLHPAHPVKPVQPAVLVLDLPLQVVLPAALLVGQSAQVGLQALVLQVLQVLQVLVEDLHQPSVGYQKARGAPSASVGQLAQAQPLPSLLVVGYPLVGNATLCPALGGAWHSCRGS